MRVKAALVIMAIILAFTAANFLLSLSFTQKNMEEAMVRELSLALDVADTLLATEIKLMETKAEIHSNSRVIPMFGVVRTSSFTMNERV